MRVHDIPARLLLGPGPSPVSDRVLSAMAHPTVGMGSSATDEAVDRLLSAVDQVLA